MRYTYLIILSFFFYGIAFSQSNIRSFQGVWQFIPPESGYDSTWLIFKNRQSLEVTFWNESKKSSIYGTPFTYFGFSDKSVENPLPKHISELDSTGNYILFYDDLIQDLTKKIKIGYDSLGNLYRPTRKCDWSFIDDGNGIEFNFGPEPDVYKRVDKVPDYVLRSLRNNKEHWKRYLDFLEHKELRIKAEKSRIYSSPNQATKMYLIKGDTVEITGEEGPWYQIRFYGPKKTIEGWIKKSDVE